MRWQMLLPICCGGDWSLFQLKLFMGWALMRVMPKRLREFMQPRVDLLITH
jgi:hypothetical protein